MCAQNLLYIRTSHPLPRAGSGWVRSAFTPPRAAVQTLGGTNPSPSSDSGFWGHSAYFAK